MQKAEQILQAMCKMGKKRIPLTRVYRSLYSEDLFLAAYDKIARNQGALTPGTENDTVDGMSLRRIRNIIDQLRHERFRFRPSRRTQIPKKSGGSRPLSIPNFSEKLVQEVLRAILDAYYEPRFLDSSHGFRPGRGCHTALTFIKQKFRGVAWFIEGDIRGCFDQASWYSSEKRKFLSLPSLSCLNLSSVSDLSGNKYKPVLVSLTIWMRPLLMRS